MKRKRRPAPPGDFEDPLSNYSAPAFADEMERALCEDTVQQIQTTPFTSVPEDTSIQSAIRTMVDLDIACLMITKDSRLVGILTERDVLEKVADDYAQHRQEPVGTFMTPSPVVCHDTDSPAQALNHMSVGGFRHIPVLDVDEKIVGILGPRRVTRYLRAQFER